MPVRSVTNKDALRVAALHSYDVLDTDSEQVFDDLVRLAAEMTESPIALVSLVDAERQWFKARFGLEARETPRETAFCAHAILDPTQPFSVPDALEDQRFRNNPLVTGAPDIRSYLGVPLVDREGHALGTLCVIDRVPRAHDPRMRRIMKNLAAAVTANLELRRALKVVSAAASTDPLTGLANRRTVVLKLTEAMARGEAVSVIAMDLDHFKEANDAFGHAAGDELLKLAAQRITAAVRSGDIVGRVGGDEFVAYLIGVSDPEVALTVVNRISTNVSAPVLYEGKRLRLAVTQGLATTPSDTDHPEILMRLADEALTRAKRRQRGSLGRVEPLDRDRVAREASVVLALKDISQGPLPGLTAHFQPLVDLRTGEVCGIEALGRWTHPELGNVPPTEMFAAAERTGHAPEVSRQVREVALAAFASLRRQGMAPFRIALNLSAAELLRPEIAQTLETQVSDAGLDMSSIIIEITEDAVLDRIAASTLHRISSLRGRGAHIALDDFGTGTSGLAQLLRIPLDTIKLDGSFIRKLGTDLKAEKVIEGVVHLGHSMGLTVTAEGIEHHAEARLLHGMGCDVGQGWLYARPMAANDLRDWLMARRLSEGGVVSLRTRGANEPLPIGRSGAAPVEVPRLRLGEKGAG